MPREPAPRLRGNALSNYSKTFNCLASGYDLAAYLRGMDFLVVPYNAVLNVRVLDDAVVADGYVGAYGAVLDDHVPADVARGISLTLFMDLFWLATWQMLLRWGLFWSSQVLVWMSVSGSPQSSHSFTGAVRNLQPCSIIVWSASVSWNSPRVRMSLPIRCWSAFLSSLTSLM